MGDFTVNVRQKPMDFNRWQLGLEYGSFTQGETQAKRVRELLRQGHCCLAPCPRLVRIAKIPQRPGVTAETRHTNVLPEEERSRTVLV